MDIDKLLVKIDSLKKLQDDIAYEITQVVSKANVISEILYSISYEDNAPVDVSEFLLDNGIAAELLAGAVLASEPCPDPVKMLYR